MARKKSTGPLSTGEVFLGSDISAKEKINLKDLGPQELRTPAGFYNKPNKKSPFEQVGENVGKAIGVKPAKTRKGSMPSTVIQAPPPSRTKGKSLVSKTVRR